MEIITVITSPTKSYTLYITPGERVEIHAVVAGSVVKVVAFNIGDQAWPGRPNNHVRWTAPIKAITSKNVIFDTSSCGGNKTKRVNYEDFRWYNRNFDAANVQAMAEWHGINS